jgi:hypothetical protein
VLKVPGFRLDSLESVVKLFDDLLEYKVSSFAAASKSFFQRIEQSRTAMVTLQANLDLKSSAELLLPIISTGQRILSPM